MSRASLSRREFLSVLARAAAGGTGLLFSGATGLSLGPRAAWAGVTLAELLSTAPRARYWIGSSQASCGDCHADEPRFHEEAFEHDEEYVRCLLCARQCFLDEGERGFCRARINLGGELRSLVYGRPLSVHVDPIEKKPFYHFLPGANAFSLATAGCPLRCKFCQNWELSQANPEDYDSEFIPADQIAAVAEAGEAPVIAFTYNEPTVFTEYLTDIARAARPLGLRSVLVSCGFMTEAPLAEICEVLDAVKIDLKGFDEGFYRDVCGAELQPVLRSIRQVSRSGVHLELVNLVVPTLNDSEEKLAALADWVMGELGPDVPVHFTRFHPDYQLRHLPPTPVDTLERAREIALDRGLHYPFVGNVPGHAGNHSYCPSCRGVVIRRRGFFVEAANLEGGCCTHCEEPIAGVWH